MRKPKKQLRIIFSLVERRFCAHGWATKELSDDQLLMEKYFDGGVSHQLAIWQATVQAFVMEVGNVAIACTVHVDFPALERELRDRAGIGYGIGANHFFSLMLGQMSPSDLVFMRNAYLVDSTPVSLESSVEGLIKCYNKYLEPTRKSLESLDVFAEEDNRPPLVHSWRWVLYRLAYFRLYRSKEEWMILEKKIKSEVDSVLLGPWGQVGDERIFRSGEGLTRVALVDSVKEVGRYVEAVSGT